MASHFQRHDSRFVVVEDECMMKPSSIRYTQDSISYKFTDGTMLTDTLRKLLSGEIAPETIKVIRVTWHNKNYYAVSGNRRLYLYKHMQQRSLLDTIPVTIVLCEEGVFEQYHTTRNQGRNVRVRGHINCKDEIVTIIDEFIRQRRCDKRRDRVKTNTKSAISVKQYIPEVSDDSYYGQLTVWNSSFNLHRAAEVSERSCYSPLPVTYMGRVETQRQQPPHQSSPARAGIPANKPIVSSYLSPQRVQPSAKQIIPATEKQKAKLSPGRLPVNVHPVHQQCSFTSYENYPALRVEEPMDHSGLSKNITGNRKGTNFNQTCQSHYPTSDHWQSENKRLYEPQQGENVYTYSPMIDHNRRVQHKPLPRRSMHEEEEIKMRNCLVTGLVAIGQGLCKIFLCLGICIAVP